MISGRLSKAWVVLEVLAAFALAHVAFRAFGRFTALGRLEYEAGVNFSPGAAMAAVALLLIALHRRRPAAWGLTLRPVAANINAGLVCLLVLVACSLAAVAVGAPFERQPASFPGASTRIGINLATAALALWLLCRYGAAIERIPVILGLGLIACAALLPLATAAARGRSPGDEALTVLWVLLASGAGEEIFFRGYIQSRLNEAFGRPWQILGVHFGPGLFGAAILFGFIHVLNRVDYFAGVYDFLWWYGLATTTTLYFGFLREITGGVLAPAVTHGMANLLARLPALLGGSA